MREETRFTAYGPNEIPAAHGATLEEAVALATGRLGSRTEIQRVIERDRFYPFTKRREFDVDGREQT